MCVLPRSATLYPNIAISTTTNLLYCSNASTLNDIDIIYESPANLAVACVRACAAGLYKYTVENMDGCATVCPSYQIHQDGTCVPSIMQKTLTFGNTGAPTMTIVPFLYTLFPCAWNELIQWVGPQV